MPTNAVYKLAHFLDDPRYRGFFGGLQFLHSLPRNRTGKWRIKRLARNWITPIVKGRVRNWNDFPNVDIVYHAFSPRAVEVLGDLLKRHGEILPIQTDQGIYSAYNATTVVNALNKSRSKIQWLPSKRVVFLIERFAFHESRLRDAAVFRIPESPVEVFVTEEFAARVREHGLGGFNLQKVWPIPANTNWLLLASEQEKAEKAKGLRRGTSVTGNTVILTFARTTDKQEPTFAERRAAERLIDKLDGLLIDEDSKSPAIGNVENHDFCKRGKCRIILSCPDAVMLRKVLGPWLKNLRWPRDVRMTTVRRSYTELYPSFG